MTYGLVVHTFTVSPSQWLALPEQTRKAKAKGTLRNVWGVTWCTEMQVAASEKPMLKAFGSGVLSWTAHLIECIGWDESLWQRLHGTAQAMHLGGFDTRGTSMY
jgi:ABC-type transport system involved in cytochrome c biogenesis permease subunit